MEVGLLHTAEIHIDTFDRLIDEIGGIDVVRSHRVDADLLAAARLADADHGAIAGRIEAHLRAFPSDTQRILCTCSTLAGAAESLGERLGRTVIRVDRPLAKAAVAHGGRIGLAYAVESTLGPTLALFTEEADLAHHLGASPAELLAVDCTHTWPHFLDGDQRGYLVGISDTIRRAVLTDRLDVVVLAQASMAEAADQLADLPLPVLSSPSLAVSALLA